MKPLPKKQKLDILSNLYWDLQISAEEIYALLYNQPGHEESPVKEINIYRRMLTSLDWYTILKILPADKVRFLLQDNVLQGLFPKDLQRKYQYVRSVLCQ